MCVIVCNEERKREGERECVCVLMINDFARLGMAGVCDCVCDKERKRESACVCVCVCAYL